MAGGESLVERSLADRLGVSRTPIRETILRLEREGLVRIIEGKGAFVASYSIEDLIEIYQVREGLEPIAARLACPHIDAKDLKFFDEQFERFRADPARHEDDPNAWLRLGKKFHGMFIEASGNKRLINALNGLHNQIELFRGLSRTISPHTVMQSTIEEHVAIVQAFIARDPVSAEVAVRTHIQSGLRIRLEGLSDRQISYRSQSFG